MILSVVSSCGREGRISLNNGTGTRLSRVTLTIGDKSQSWSDIEPDETFNSRLQVPADVPCNLTWEASGRSEEFDFTTISRAPEAEKISILFSSNGLSVGYEF